MRVRSIFSLAGIVALSVLAISVLAMGCAGQTDPPPSGDWTVADTTLVKDRTVDLHGDLVVTSSGSLTLENVTLRIHLSSTGQRGIEVQTGGSLTVRDGDGDPSTTGDASNITSQPTSRSYWFKVRSGTTLRVSNSFINHCGHLGMVGSEHKGLFIGSNNAVIEGSVIQHGNEGLTLRDAVVTVRDSHIINCTYHGVSSEDTDLTMTATVLADNGNEGARIVRGDVVLDGCQVLNNRNGLHVRTGANVTLANTTVKGNQDGLLMQIDPVVEVINCTFHSQGQYGINARDRGALTISDSILAASTRTALYAYNRIGITSSGNIYRNNAVYGVLLKADCIMRSTGDAFRGNTNSGVYLNHTSRIYLDQCSFFKNSAGVKGEGNSKVFAWATTVEECTFEGYLLGGCDLELHDGIIRNCTGGGIKPEDDSATRWTVHAGNSSSLVSADCLINDVITVAGDLALEDVTISFDRPGPTPQCGIDVTGGQQDWSNVTFKGTGTASEVLFAISNTASGTAWHMTLENADDTFVAPHGKSRVSVPFEFHMCTFKDSTNALFIENGDVVMDRCAFSGNDRGAHVLGVEVRFENCTFTSNTVDDVVVDNDGHAVLVNCSFDPRKVDLKGNGDRLSVWWMVHVHVEYPTGASVSSAGVTVKDRTGTQVALGTTGPGGNVANLLLRERTVTGTSTDDRNPHTFNATSDGSSNETQVTVDRHMTVVLVLLDSDPPVLTITSHSEGDYITDPHLVLRGTASDVGSAVFRVEAAIATQVWTTCVGTESWEWTYDLPGDGRYPIHVRARDMVLNEVIVHINLTLDTTSPDIQVISPPNGTLVSTENVTLSGWVDDPDTVVSWKDVIAAMNGTRFSLTVTVVDGPNLIAIHAVDPAGNEAWLHWSVPADLEAPPLSVTSPTNGSRHNTTVVTLEGTTSPGMQVYYRLLERPTQVWSLVSVTASGAFSVELEGLLQGANTLQVMVRDSADNEARLTLVFFVDTQPPQLLSVSPEDGSPVRDPSINLTGTMSEALSYLTVGGEAAEVDGANFSILLELDGDAKQYPLRAADELGNVVHITLRYILDQTPPFLEFPGLTYDEEEGTFGPKHTNQRSFMLLGNTELGATVYIDVWDYGVDERGRFGATLDLEEGTNVLPVLVRDLAGNELVTNVTLVLDTQSPELVVESPEHMHRTTNDYVWVEGTVTPGDLVIANEEVIVVDNGTFRFKVGLEEAVNRMVIIARDDAGNEVSVERLVFVVEDTEGLTGHPVLDSGCNSILVAVIIVAIVMAIIAGVSMKGVDVLDRRERQLEQVMEEEHIELDKPHLEPTTGQLEYDPTSPTGRAPGFEEAEDEEFISMSDFRREMEKRKG